MLTQDRLKELLDYNAETGAFVWRASRHNKKRVGDVAGSPNSKGYLMIGVDGRLYKAHRLAWLYVYGRWPKYEIDHKDHNKASNAIDNLQDVPKSVNSSRKKAYGVVKLKGVCKSGNKFRAAIWIDGKPKHLGYFENATDAHMAWAEEAKKLYGGQFFCDCIAHGEDLEW